MDFSPIISSVCPPEIRPEGGSPGFEPSELALCRSYPHLGSTDSVRAFASCAIRLRTSGPVVTGALGTRFREGSGIASKTPSDLYKTAPRGKADPCHFLCLLQVCRQDSQFPAWLARGDGGKNHTFGRHVAWLLLEMRSCYRNSCHFKGLLFLRPQSCKGCEIHAEEAFPSIARGAHLCGDLIAEMSMRLGSPYM